MSKTARKVRSIAEETILVMGTAAKEYLDKRRAQASLKTATLNRQGWQRMVTEGPSSLLYTKGDEMR